MRSFVAPFLGRAIRDANLTGALLQESRVRCALEHYSILRRDGPASGIAPSDMRGLDLLRVPPDALALTAFGAVLWAAPRGSERDTGSEILVDESPWGEDFDAAVA